MTPGSDARIRSILTEFYRQQNIDNHQAAIASWPRWKRIAHAVTVGWRCPACIAAKEQSPTDTTNK